jgi:3-hydroxybutyryl-CoA dehydratase
MSRIASHLTPGTRLPPLTYRVDQSLIDLYAQLSGDHNPLHTDPAFANTTHFGRTIAHGMMTLAFLSEAIESWAGSAWSNGGSIDVTFLTPVYPGEDVAILGMIETITESGIVSCAIECSASGRKVVACTARWPRNPERAGK